MPVGISDIHFYKSAIGDSTGGGATGTQITGVTKNNFFADLSDVERAAGGTRIRKLFVGNDHASDFLAAPKVWIDPDIPGFNPTQIGLGFDDSDDDTGTQGSMTAFAAAAVAALVSTAADTRNALVVGINNATSLPDYEMVTLNGSTQVLSTKTWSTVYGVQLDAEHGTNTVTVKQGSGGTTRGTIGPNLSTCFLWVSASSEGTALWLPDLISGARWGIWMKQVWAAGVSALRPADPVLKVKES